MTRRMARNLGALAAGETYDEAGGNPDPTTAAQIKIMAANNGTLPLGPSWSGFTPGWKPYDYTATPSSDTKSKTLLIVGAVALGLLLFGGLGGEN